MRFDGVRFTVFDRTNTPALQGRNIHGLAVDPEGTLWIGLETGLVRLREGVFLPVVPPAGTVLDHPQQLLATRDGSVWIATAEHGLARLFQGRFQTWSKAHGLAETTRQDARGQAVVAVSDTGMGIPAHQAGGGGHGPGAVHLSQLRAGHGRRHPGAQRGGAGHHVRGGAALRRGVGATDHMQARSD